MYLMYVNYELINTYYPTTTYVLIKILYFTYLILIRVLTDGTKTNEEFTVFSKEIFRTE